MINNETKFFVIEYAPNDEGAPYFMDKEWHPELPDFNLFTSPPLEAGFSNKYLVKAKAKKINVDYLPYDHLISENMYNLLSDLNVKCIKIPIDIILFRKKVPEKKYYLFFPLCYLSIMDIDNSLFTISKDIESGKLNTPEERNLDKVYYDKIDKFVIKSGIKEHLFFCKEISKTVCSELFKNKFESLGLQGVLFQEIDENYKYDPWDGW